MDAPQVSKEEQLKTVIAIGGVTKIHIRAGGEWVELGDAEFKLIDGQPCALLDLSTEQGITLAPLLSMHFLGIQIIDTHQ